MPTVELRRQFSFRAVGRLKDMRTGNPIGPVLGHQYTVGLIFTGDQRLLLPTTDPDIEQIITLLTDFVAEHWADQDLTGLPINPTPMGMCWYLTELLAGRVDRPELLTAVALTIDEGDVYTFWPADRPAADATR